MAKKTPNQVRSTMAQQSKIEQLMNKVPKGEGPILYDKTNYILMAVGVIMIIVGFLLMSGGTSQDPNVFDTSEIYSTRRITIAPIVILLGFIVEIIAVLKRPSVRVS
ncbi:MAG TPA: DUF3098 domain-containing protein [Chitinophagales bacterium]|nr:DUF3098 domain-containing protein [Chitinophagales bacterium]